ncbi:MAG: type I-C CRISPR-associated protein Cas8c/Csd1 [Chloroflexaceae bacterium]
MLLQKLKEYADMRMTLPPPLYSETPVRYIIELDRAGTPLSPQPTDTADPSNRRTKRGQIYMMPQVQRSSGIKPLLLASNAEYTLGLARDPAKQPRVAAGFAAYVDLVDRCVAATQEPAIQAVQTFLHNDPAAQLHLAADFDRGATITFRVDGHFPTDIPSVQAFWAAEHRPTAGNAAVMQCIVCGQERPVLERLQGKIKGVPGGQSSGTALISANAEAFESYGLEASLIAPTCADCGERFTKAANDLLGSEQNRVFIAGSVVIFWTRQAVDFNFFTFLTDADAQQVQALIEAVRTGKWIPDVDATAFYSVMLSASGGRTVVRDWIDTTVGTAKAHLARWFLWQRVVDAYGEAARPLGIRALAAATVRELKDLPTPTIRALFRTALIGTPLPTSMLYQTIRRCRAAQNVTHQQAALIKLVLCSQNVFTQETAMIELDLDNRSPAYRCGRLLAVLAEVQRNAIGKAAIVDRFYGTASSAPASVFPRLLRGAQPHLTKLERDKRPTAHALQQRLEEVMSGITHFPTTLTLNDQGLFALGFYHQRAYDRSQMMAASARKKAADTATSAPESADC